MFHILPSIKCSNRSLQINKSQFKNVMLKLGNIDGIPQRMHLNNEIVVPHLEPTIEFILKLFN